MFTPWVKSGEYPKAIGAAFCVEYTSEEAKSEVMISRRLASTEIKIDFEINDKQLSEKVLNSLETDCFYSKYSWNQSIATSDERLLAYFLLRISRVSPNLHSCAHDIAIALKLSDSYSKLPLWISNKDLTTCTSNFSKIKNVWIRNNNLNINFRDKQGLESFFQSLTEIMFDSAALFRRENMNNLSFVLTNETLFDADVIIVQLEQQAPEFKEISQKIRNDIHATCNIPTRTTLIFPHRIPTLLDRAQIMGAHPVYNLAHVCETLADRLLTGELDNDKEENDSICYEILKLTNKTSYDYAALKKHTYLLPQTTKEIKNIDDIKWHVKREGFNHNFLHDHTETNKNSHLNILRSLITREIRNKANLETGYDKIENIERLRALLKENMGSHTPDVFFSLLIVAKYWPVNTGCPISLEEIDDKNKLFVSTGHQFDIHALMEYNARRMIRYDLGESDGNRTIINPITNLVLHDLDQMQIAHYLRKPHNKKYTLFDMQNFGAFLHFFDTFFEMRLPRTSLFRIASLPFSDICKLESLIKNSTNSALTRLALTNLIDAGLSIEHLSRLSEITLSALLNRSDLAPVLRSIGSPHQIAQLSEEALSVLNKWVYEKDFNTCPGGGEDFTKPLIANPQDLDEIREKVVSLLDEQRQNTKHKNNQ